MLTLICYWRIRGVHCLPLQGKEEFSLDCCTIPQQRCEDLKLHKDSRPAFQR